MIFPLTQRTKLFAAEIIKGRPVSYASLRGSKAYPHLHGKVSFYGVRGGTLVVAEVFGLPTGTGNCGQKVFGFHIHEGRSCTGNAEDPFSNAGSHLNPSNCPHPSHAGDMPPLFGNNGYAWSAFFTQRLTAAEAIGRTVIIHGSPDDFHTQPSGDAGMKIACGEIKRA